MKCELKLSVVPWLVGLGFLSSCAPTVYLIDRQTVLELEASGDWQDLDNVYQKNQLATGPLPLEKTQTKLSQNTLFGMTHSDSDKAIEGPAGQEANKAKDKR